MKQAMHQDMSNRWIKLTQDIPSTILMSLYLDPRFKKLSFISDPVRRGVVLSRASFLVSELLTSDPNLSKFDDDVVMAQEEAQHTLYLGLFGSAVIGSQTRSDQLRTKSSITTREPNALSSRMLQRKRSPTFYSGGFGTL
jgi:hypothetical protein